MRQPYQVIAFPYKKDSKDNYLYAIFYRTGEQKMWQAISGGVEEGETFIEACKREAKEEAGISYNAPVISLKSMCTIPVANYDRGFFWGEEVYLVHEYSFGIDATNEEIKLSEEHSKVEWLPYKEARAKLKWDSNKNALWELNWKLENDKTNI